jgi:hypothetical protein
MTKSSKTPLVIAGVSAFLAACCWLLRMPPTDTSQWSEKMWSVHLPGFVLSKGSEVEKL